MPQLEGSSGKLNDLLAKSHLVPNSVMGEPDWASLAQVSTPGPVDCGWVGPGSDHGGTSLSEGGADARAGNLPEPSRWIMGVGGMVRMSRLPRSPGKAAWQAPKSPLCAPAVVLVVVFGICWAPFHVDRLMWSFVSQWTEGLDLAFQYVHVISGVLFYLSSAVNPVLYNVMSSRFRETFQEALCLGPQCRYHRPHHNSHSLSRVTMGSTLCDLGSLGIRTHPLTENGGREGLQETDPF